MDEDTREKSLARKYQQYFESCRNTYLKRHYNITLKQYNDQLIKQDFGCAICGSADAKNKRSKHNVFSVDHCHENEVVRGLLCTTCNTIIVPAIEYYQHLFDRAKNYLDKCRIKESDTGTYIGE